MKKILAVLAVLALMAPVAALAEGGRTDCEEGVVCLDDEFLEVEIQRPRAFYIIDRSRLRHQGTPQEQSFTDDIVRSVDGGPF